MSSTKWERLGRRVTSERARRGYRSLAAFAQAAGLSTSTVDSIEHWRRQGYDPNTLAKLEHALGWRSGSVARVLNGLEPLPDEDPDFTAIRELWPRLPPGSRRMLRILAIEAARAEGDSLI